MRLVTTALTLALLWQASARVAPEPKHFRFERDVKIEPGTPQRACVMLDGTVYAHAAPALVDVRLFGGEPAAEIPYALTMSETAVASDAAPIYNLGLKGSGSAQRIVFDLQMPARPYSSVNLDLKGKDFLASAKVTGLTSLKESNGTSLGTFTLFDLTSQRLGRSTTLALAESSFPFLHVELGVTAAPGHPGIAAEPAMMAGAEVPPSREAQTLYSSVAETTSVSQRGQESVAVFEVPAHVPVERVAFEMAAGDKTNFSRAVRITATALTDSNATGQRPVSENIEGQISRVRITEAGQQIRQESLAVRAIVGSNGQSAAKIEIAVENGDDRPLAIRAVRLEMRERKLCFDVPAGQVTMMYADGALVAPTYDYSRLFSPAEAARAARLAAEMANPAYVARVESKPFMERHPEILWVALFAVVSLLGVVAFRSVKRV